VYAHLGLVLLRRAFQQLLRRGELQPDQVHAAVCTTDAYQLFWPFFFGF